LPCTAVQTTLITFFDTLVRPFLLILQFLSGSYAKSPEQVYDDNNEGDSCNHSTDNRTNRL
jgi:hypothetical protein